MNQSYYIDHWNRNVYHSISIDAKIEQIEQILGYQFPKEAKPTNHWELCETLIKIINNWKEYLGPNQGQRKEIKEYLNIKEELDGQKLIQKLIDKNLKWQLTLEFQKPQLISMEAHHLLNKMVYTTGYHINLLEPYLVTREQHEKITEKITHKINKYLKAN